MTRIEKINDLSRRIEEHSCAIRDAERIIRQSKEWKMVCIMGETTREKREREYKDMIAEKRRREEESDRRRRKMEKSSGIPIPMGPRSPDPPMESGFPGDNSDARSFSLSREESEEIFATLVKRAHEKVERHTAARDELLVERERLIEEANR